MTLPTNFTLLPSQDKAKSRLTSQRRHFLFFRMGLGKTPTTCVALHTIQPTKVLIICPKNATRVWEDHIAEWFVGFDTKLGRTTPYIVRRWRKKQQDAQKRKAIWKEFTLGVTNFYVMTYAGFLKDTDVLKPDFDVIILDEAKRIRSHKSEVFKALKPYTKAAKYFWPMTGTPGISPKDFWTLFHLADPSYFSSYWKFVGAFHYIIMNEWGRKEILPGIRNKDEWDRLLSTKASILTKPMVQAEYKTFPKQRDFIPVELDAIQDGIYKQLDEHMYAITNDAAIIAQNSMVRMLRFRQLFVCPKILDPKLETNGAAFDDFLEKLEDTDPHVVCFTPFTEAFPHFIAGLKSAGHTNVYTLSGACSSDEVADRIAAFRKSRGIILCSTTFAESFSLEPAAEAFHIGYDYNPEVNDQAEDRLERLTTTYPVNHYYYRYMGTYDETAAELVVIKREKISTTIDISKVGLKF